MRTRIAESVRTGFWAIPSGCVLLAVALALSLVQLDHALDTDVRFTFGAGPDGAREVLSAISSSMITFTGLVFSITIVVLALTSSQFSPRVLRTFLRDRQTQISLGVFVATFVYSVTVLRTVSSVTDNTFVPSIATTVGLGLLLASVGVFIGFIHHIATSIQVTSILAAIGAETRQTIDKRYPAGTSQAQGPLVRPAGLVSLVIPASGQGVVTTIDVRRIVSLAEHAGVVVRTDLRPGDFVPEGAPLLEVLGEPGDLDVSALAATISLGRERTMQQDVAFGFRQLVDVAEKALSPGINDPTTAVQALDQLHDLLRRLASRPLPDGVHTDDGGHVRLMVPAETMQHYVSLALDEISQYGADAAPVQARIAALRHDVLSAARPEHRAALQG